MQVYVRLIQHLRLRKVVHATSFFRFFGKSVREGALFSELYLKYLSVLYTVASAIVQDVNDALEQKLIMPVDVFKYFAVIYYSIYLYVLGSVGCV